MKTLRRLFFASISMLLCISPAGAAGGDTVCHKKLKIGVSLPLTAGAVSSGEAVKNSIILADEKYDTAHCVDFLFDDDQLLAKNTVTVVNKFLNVDHVDGLIVYGTPTSIAVGDMVEAKKTPLIALSILGKVVQGRNYIMKHWCTAERLTQAITSEVKTRHYRKVAIVSTQNDAMLGLRDLFIAGKAAEVVLDEEFARDIYDFRTIIAKIVAAKADAVYVLLYPPQTAPFVKQLREQGFVKDAFGVHNIEDPNEVAVSDGKMLGMWLANGDDSAGENYTEDYLKRFGARTALGGGSGFDGAKMYIESAYQDADVNTFLHTLKGFNGAFGRYNATSSNDYDFEAVIKIVEKDGFKKTN
jgi:ABC-type branched-subunit amino acid transport system substrate-binding protein